MEKTPKTEFIDWTYTMHLQNTNGRETPEEMFIKGIEAAWEERDYKNEPEPITPEAPNYLEEIGEKEVLINAFAKIMDAFRGRYWLIEGRGCYPYNDDRYKEEVKYLMDEVEAIEKDVWANIKTKTVDYRKKIIADYLKSQPAESITPEALEKEGFKQDGRWFTFSQIGIYFNEDGYTANVYCGTLKAKGVKTMQDLGDLINLIG